MSIDFGMRPLTRFAMVQVMVGGVLLGLCSTFAAAQTATQTTLTAETREISGHTVATLTTSVLDADGTPATGTVTLVEHGREIAGAALNAEGRAAIKLDALTAGDHALRALYSGDTARLASHSEAVVVHPLAAATPDFGIAIVPAALTLKAGAAGIVALTVTPQNSFTGFISLSCSGLPIGVTCTYTPANLQVTDTTPTVKANLTVQTTAPAGKTARNEVPQGLPGTGHTTPLVLAVLLPGILGLGFLGRKRNLLGRAALLLMVAVLSITATTACSARYGYFHHPPTYNPGTPKGSYTVTVTAQTSNGLNATEHTASLALTVN